MAPSVVGPSRVSLSLLLINNWSTTHSTTDDRRERPSGLWIAFSILDLFLPTRRGGIDTCTTPPPTCMDTLFRLLRRCINYGQSHALISTRRLFTSRTLHHAFASAMFRPFISNALLRIGDAIYSFGGHLVNTRPAQHRQ